MIQCTSPTPDIPVKFVKKKRKSKSVILFFQLDFVGLRWCALSDVYLISTYCIVINRGITFRRNNPLFLLHRYLLKRFSEGKKSSTKFPFKCKTKKSGMLKKKYTVSYGDILNLSFTCVLRQYLYESNKMKITNSYNKLIFVHWFQM